MLHQIRGNEMTDTSHLTALHTRLMNERARLAAATRQQEIAQRQVWIAQCEREIAGECQFLGIANILADKTEMSADDIFAELMA
jgi:hypothetical protein